jgi:hypothetical protein
MRVENLQIFYDIFSQTLSLIHSLSPPRKSKLLTFFGME